MMHLDGAGPYTWHEVEHFETPPAVVPSSPAGPAVAAKSPAPAGKSPAPAGKSPAAAGKSPAAAGKGAAAASPAEFLQQTLAMGDVKQQHLRAVDRDVALNRAIMMRVRMGELLAIINAQEQSDYNKEWPAVWKRVTEAR
eukprot:gene32070-18262_t